MSHPLCLSDNSLVNAFRACDMPAVSSILSVFNLQDTVTINPHEVLHTLELLQLTSGLLKRLNTQVDLALHHFIHMSYSSGSGLLVMCQPVQVGEGCDIRLNPVRVKWVALRCW